MENPNHKWRFRSLGKSSIFYPLVNIQKTMERSTMLLMGKSTISMGLAVQNHNYPPLVVSLLFVGNNCLPEGISWYIRLSCKEWFCRIKMGFSRKE